MNDGVSLRTTHRDAAARGKLRVLKQQLAARYRVLDKLMDNKAIEPVISALVLKKGVGRQRAFQKICAAVAPLGAHRVALDLTGKQPLLVWAMLKPRTCVSLQEEATPLDRQNCVGVNYLMIGLVAPEISGLSEGLWTIEVQDHALGRFLERAPSADPVAAMLTAHYVLLTLDTDSVLRCCNNRSDLVLPAGPGAFICSVSIGTDVSANDEPMVHVIARTWVAADMLQKGQDVLPTSDEPLGTTFLLPQPLREVRFGEASPDHPGRRRLEFRAWRGLPKPWN